MKKISVSKRISAAWMALVLLVSCVLTVSAGDAYTGDSGTGKTIVKISSGGGGVIWYNVTGQSVNQEDMPWTTGMFMSRSVPVGTVCTATAEDTDDLPFMYWINEYGSRICSYEPTITFIAGSRANYTAVFDASDDTQRMVQYVNYGGNPLISNYIISKGTTVSRPSNPSAAGFTFRGWSKTPSEVNDSDESMIVTANFDVKKETYTVVLTNDAYVSGAGTYANYSTVNLKAKAKDGAGRAFSYWKNSDGQIVSYDPNYSFRINYNTTLTAVYGESVTAEPIVRVSRIYRDPDNYQMTVFAERSVPEAYKVVSHGMLMSVSATVKDTQMTVSGGGDLPSAAVRKVYGNSTENCGTFSLAKSLLLDSTTVTARPFLIYQDATGKEFVTYGEIIRTTNAD